MKKGLKYSVFTFVLLLFLSAIVSPKIDTYAAEDYRGWSQADSRWASIRLGSSSYTVKSSGCLATSVTKLIIQAGLKDADSFNVKTMVKTMNSSGGFTSGGLFCWDKAACCASGFKYAGNLMSYGTYSAKSYNDKLLKWIKDGYHLVIAVKYAGHWVAVDEAKSLEKGKIYIMDSASSTVSENMNVSLQEAYGTFNRVAAFKGGKTATVEKEEEKQTKEVSAKKEAEGTEAIAVSSLTAPSAVQLGKTYTVNKMKYKVTEVYPEGGGTVTLTGTKTSKKALKNLTVKATVKIEGEKFKVTKIGKEAFKGYNKLKQLTIGKNVTEIGKKAFYQCSKLKTVTVKTTVLTKVGKNALKKLHKKVQIIVPEEKTEEYGKLFS